MKFKGPLIGVGVGLLALMLSAALLGGIKGMAIGHAGYGPGVDSAIFAAFIALFLVGVPVGIFGFLVGLALQGHEPNEK